jgi:hypothetical protein
MRRLSRGEREDEKGAVLVLVALASLILVTMAALVVDVGSLLDERRQLQNGADAAALGVAQIIAATCPNGPCSASTLSTAAQSLVDANALDSATKVDAVVPDYAAKRVAVRTSTRDRAGGTILPYWFGQAVTGSKGRTVRASAAATWSGLKRASVIPLTLSKCEFDRATSNSTVFGGTTVVYFHTKANPCSGANGLDLPGGFGWLTDDNDENPNDCNVTPTAGGTMREDSGVPGTPHSCNLSTLLGTDVLLPLYSSRTGTGANGIYTIYGFGQFHLTGYRFSSSNRGGVVPCGAPNTCLGGYFVRFVGTGDYGGPNLGNHVALVS